MEKPTYEQRREEVLDVCHYEKQLYEIPIPGMEAYTIDAEMIVRSYKKPGSPYIIRARVKKHGGCEYNLWCTNEYGLREKMSFTPLRLYMCACSGLDPRITILDDFEYDKDGNPIVAKFRTRKSIKNKPGKIISTHAYRREMTDKERQLALIARSEYEIKILQKAVETENYEELMKVMWSYKRIVIPMLFVKWGIRSKRTEELFSIAVEHIIQRIKRDHIVIRNLLWSLIHCAHQAKLNNA